MPLLQKQSMGTKKTGQHAVNETASKKRTWHLNKHKHSHQEKFILSGMTNKIFREALIQKKEEQALQENSKSQIYPEEPDLLEDYDENDEDYEYDYESSLTKTCSYLYEEKNADKDEELLDPFVSGCLPVLGDAILQKIKEKDEEMSSGNQLRPELDESFVELYKGVGFALSKFASNKLPDAFKFILQLNHWEEVLYMTEPANWTPKVREDIKKNKRLHVHLYQAVKRSLFKKLAFFEGLLLPLCKSVTFNVREAVIIGSIIKKAPLNSRKGNMCDVTLLKLAAMEYRGTTSYQIKLLLDKGCALKYSVLDTLVSHFTKYSKHEEMMPVIWHLSLLSFVQRYKNDLTKEHKTSLNILVEHQRHTKVTPEVRRELKNSYIRGEKKNDLLSLAASSPLSNKATEEDRVDIPDVPMEED